MCTKGEHNLQNNREMKTKEEILDEKKILRTAFALIEIGENEDGSPYYLGTDDDSELDECVTIAESYASQRIEKYRELIEVMDKLYEVSCDALYEHKIDPTGEMGKLYIKTQLLKTELGL